MSEPRIGQRVITDNGEGIVDTITVGSSVTDVLRYRITSTLTTRRRWYYLDEFITIDEHASVDQ